jgi:endonuclease-3
MHMAREKYAMKVILLLKRKYGLQLQTTLEHSTPWELLVATILSAQSPDVQVNKVTGRLFKRYAAARDFAVLRPQTLYPYIGSLGLYRGKARNIVGAAKAVVHDFRGKVPSTMAQLITLPGVGRKTANVVLTDAFGISEGIAIDTHCIVVSNRLGLVRTRDPKKIEKTLMRIVPKSEWCNINLLFIALGRDVCTARRKYCEDCVLNKICPSSDVS